MCLQQRWFVCRNVSSRSLEALGVMLEVKDEMNPSQHKVFFYSVCWIPARFKILHGEKICQIYSNSTPPCSTVLMSNSLKIKKFMYETTWKMLLFKFGPLSSFTKYIH